jgi:hypothetical protein
MLLSLSLIVLLLLKLVSLKEITSLTLNGISVLIGAPLGLSLAHWVRVTHLNVLLTREKACLKKLDTD